MNDLTLHTTADDNKKSPTSRFVISGLLGVLIIVLGLTVGGYYRLQANALEDRSRRIQTELQRKVVTVESFHTQADSDAAGSSDNQLISDIGQAATKITGVQAVSLLDGSGEIVWSSNRGPRMTGEEQAAATKMSRAPASSYTYYGHDLLKLETWLRILKKDFEHTPLLTTFRFKNGANGVAKLMVDNRAELITARRLAMRLMMVAALSTLLLFLLLYFNFRRVIRRVDEQDEKVNQQIASLSNLLASNKEMQKSIKTASARAVELNEQFLRRVGADLHDGPAQMIGFAVLRLNQVSKQEAAKQLDHEFHAVRDALDEALDEIRGISSGLVLPELEQLTLEQCLRKVVTLHSSKSDAVITQYYQDLPDNIPLPIKICAYRFLQEGLNNAERHGQAQKCRITAQVRDDVLHLSLKDNGMGFRKSRLSAEGGHLGLMGLKDRIESLGGKFSINSELGVGTALKLSIQVVDDG